MYDHQHRQQQYAATQQDAAPPQQPQQRQQRQQQQQQYPPPAPQPVGPRFSDQEPLLNHDRYYKLRDINRWDAVARCGQWRDGQS